MSLERDAWKLMVDGKKIREKIEKLERDCDEWFIDQQEEDLAGLIKTIKEVETDLDLMLVDFISADFQTGEGEDGVLACELPRIFAHLDSLFDDVENAKSELKEGHVSLRTVQSLELGHRRFTKSVRRIGKEGV